MTALLLNGTKLAKQLQKDLAEVIKKRIEKGFSAPGLAVILINDSPASISYVKRKRHACETIGIQSYNYNLPNTTSEIALLQLIEELNQAKHIDGILVQLPLPEHINTFKIIESIHPDKDVDGFHPYNLGRLAQRNPFLRPCTPYGIMQLLNAYQIPITGKHTVIIGTSNIVGRPMGLEMLMANATVTLCHRATVGLEHYVSDADILIIATGTHGCIDPNWLQKHQVVVDVGIHRLPNGKVCGDLNFDVAKKRVAWISPVPGGVGPMTVTALLQNTLTAAQYHQEATSHPNNQTHHQNPQAPA